MLKTTPYTRIPGTELKPFRICLGTVPLGSTVTESDSFQLMDAYLEAGGNFIDTAKVYADWLPNEGSTSEKCIGRWMRARRSRSRIILASKGAHPELDSMHVGRMSPSEIQYDLEASLRHLQTDIIDLYWLHRDDISRPVEEVIDTLNGHVKSGKIRYFGCSNWRAGRIQAANGYAERSGQQGFAANQPLWNLAQVDMDAFTDKTITAMDEEMYAYHLESGLAAVPYTAQANGLFNKMAAGSVDALAETQQRVYASPINQERFERVQKLAQETGYGITQIVLAYLLSQPFSTIPIIGSRTLEQLRDSLSAAEIQLKPNELQFLLSGA
jgi:aryl-alcohol dehydrogenase-like predicted oxidoreductase